MGAKRREYVSIYILSILILFISGCGTYGKLRVESRHFTIASNKLNTQYGERMTIQKLINNWKDYDIYYAGYRRDRALGIMFDPKADDLRLLADWYWWAKVDSKDSLDFIFKWMDLPRDFWEVIPLYRMVGSGDKVYGYMFTPFIHVTFKQIDEKSMYVYSLEWSGWGMEPGDTE